ncbi:MAG: 30S ribosome-binding factor RbfA [Candidatus Omnitrophica bacterium]|nr:30S ribosome-binding factor RbfA [Candidatus Omnitrophota bacterium]
MTLETRRREKMEHLIRREGEDIIRREVSDPRIGFFTITHVKVTGDLKLARVSVSFMGTEEQKKKSFEGLQSAKRYIHHRLAGRLVMRFCPELEFILDQRPEYRIEALLLEIKKEKDERNQGDPD